MYTICFDFPGYEGQPMFSKAYEGAFGVTSILRAATTFKSEAKAARVLEAEYTPNWRRYGCVVEVEK